jgi:Tfp pilus assembly protein FimT
MFSSTIETGETMKQFKNINFDNKSDFQKNRKYPLGGSGNQRIRNRFSPFTLIEIIVVVGIMALLMAVTMPAFSSMMKGAGVEGAARNICQVLKMARSFAINNREYVAVVMPNKGLNDTYHNRAYKICIVDGSNTFKRWVQGEKWNFLPNGVAIMYITTKDPKSTTPTLNDFSNTDITNVNCEDIGAGETETLKGVVFKPNGKINQTPPSSLYIGLTEGVATGGTLTRTNPDGVPTNVVIGQYTGRITYGNE